MTPDPDDSSARSEEPLDEVRQAASEVVGSLKKLLEAAEKVVADPAAFDQVVAGGKGLFDAFTSGYSEQMSDDVGPDHVDADESGPADQDLF